MYIVYLGEKCFNNIYFVEWSNQVCYYILYLIWLFFYGKNIENFVQLF